MFCFIGFLLLIYCCGNKRKESSNVQKEKPKILNNLLEGVCKNDTLLIKRKSVGCFHFSVEELRIFRKPDSLFAELTYMMPHIKKKFKPLTSFLSDSSVAAYDEFERSGKILKTENDCTTKESYVISLKTDSIKFNDFDCKFHAYDSLKDKLFGKSELEKFYEQTYHP